MEFVPEGWLRGAESLLVRLVDAAATVIIFVGAVVAFVLFVFTALRGRSTLGFERIRLMLGRFLALGLEFQLGADLLRTAVAPTWEQIGQLAAVAAIRTGLNFFLSREIREEQRQSRREELRRTLGASGARAPDLERGQGAAASTDSEPPLPPH